MPDRHVIAKGDRGFLVERVENRTVLDVAMLTDGDSIHIAAQHGVEPQARSFSHRHIADNRGVLCHEHVVSNVRGEDLSVSIDGLNKSHSFLHSTLDDS